MNPAKRIDNVLVKIPKSGEKQAIKAFEKIFDVSGCHAVSNKLSIIMIQVEYLAAKGVSKELIGYLYNMFSCYNLARDLSSELQNFAGFKIALETAAALMPTDMDNIDPKDITEIADILEQLRSKLESGTISEEYKSIIESFIDEIRDALTDIEYGGIEAFSPHIETAFGKVAIYHGAFEKSGILEDISNIHKKVTKVMDDAQIWTGAIGFAIAKLTQ